MPGNAFSSCTNWLAYLGNETVIIIVFRESLAVN